MGSIAHRLALAGGEVVAALLVVQVGRVQHGRPGLRAPGQVHARVGLLFQLACQEVGHFETDADPGNGDRAHQRHHDHLVSLAVDNLNGRRFLLGAGGRCLEQAGVGEGQGRHLRLQRVGHHLAIHVEHEHPVGIEALAVAFERGNQGVVIALGHQGLEGEVVRQQARIFAQDAFARVHGVLQR